MIASFLLIVVSLLAIGLVMVTSASISENARVYPLDSSFDLMKRQCIFLAISGFVWLCVLQVPLSVWEKYNVFLLLGSLGLLVLVLMLGKSINGSVRWIHLGPVNFQPSELSKLALFCLYIWLSHP